MKQIDNKEVYEITTNGRQLVNKLLEENATLKNLMKDIEQLKKKWNATPLIKLLRYVYMKYPEYAEKSMIKHMIL